MAISVFVIDLDVFGDVLLDLAVLLGEVLDMPFTVASFLVDVVVDFLGGIVVKVGSW